MDARAILARIDWRHAFAAVLFVLAAELATVLTLVNAEDARWQHCYGTRSEPSISREGCPDLSRSSEQSARVEAFRPNP